MTDTISWVATVATVVAASMTAANLGSRVTGYGFCVFLAGSLAWLTTGILTGQAALTWTNVVLTVLNIFGIWRWLGRQARVEDGGKTAAKASEQTPGEALFPISLLTSATAHGGGGELGKTIDAMAGCRSGKIAYVVVSEGGIAGVGETFRRVPWAQAEVEGSTLLLDMDARQFSHLERLPKDSWPAR